METLHSRAVKTRGEPIFGGRSRRNRFCARLILAAALLVLSAPAGAHAALTVGYQADYWTIDAGDPGLRDRTLELMMGARAGWVRFMVRENDYAQRASAYQAAMSAARARGLRVMATLLRWRGGDGSQAPGATPAQWRAFARQAVDQLGPLVDAWGVMNEPNIAPFAPDSRVVCQLSTRADTGGSTRVDPAASTRVNDSPRGNARVRADTRRHRRARRGHDARVRTRRGARRVVGDRRSAHGRSPRVVQLGRAQRRRPSYRRVVRRGRADRRSPSHRRRRVGVPVVTPAGTTYVPTDSLQRACQAQALGAAYRAVYDDAARVLRAGDQTAPLIVGELAPGASNHEFMEAMFNAAPGPVDADVFAVHGYHIGTPDSEGEPGAYRITTIEATTAQVRAWHARGALTGDRTWITEIGYPPNLPADYLPRALDRAQQAGVEVSVIYDLVAHPDGPGVTWDTGVLDATFTPRPAWARLLNWLGAS